MNKTNNFWADVFSAWINNIIIFAKAELKIIGLVFLVIMFGLKLIGYESTVLIAAGITLLDLFPVVGSGLVFIPWVIYEWFWGNPTQAWQLLVLYLIVAIAKQLIEPLFLGKDLEMPFWMPIVIIIGSTMIFNVFGILVSALLIPFVAAYRQVSRQYRRL